MSIDVYSAKIRCECGNVSRISFSETPNSVIPRKCSNCGYNMNKRFKELAESSSGGEF